MKVSHFYQTPFVDYNDKNVILIDVADWDGCNAYELSVYIDNQLIIDKYRKLFRSVPRLLIPNPQKTSSL